MADASETEARSSQDSSVSSTESNGETVTSLESRNSNSGKIEIQLSSPRSGALNNSFRLFSNVFGSSPVKSTSSRTFVLNPPKLSNPFASSPEKNESADDQSDDKTTNPVDEKNINHCQHDREDKTKPNDGKMRQDIVKKMAEGGKSVSFMPLRGEPATPCSGAAIQPFSQSSSPALGFVFGQNIHEKVEAAAPGETSTSVTEPVGAAQETEEVKTNGATSEMLFSSSIKKENSEKSTDTSGKTLSEAAREYEEARAVKRKFEEVQVVTGEEEESNVLQINCKLFSWSEYSWVEMGRGTLRVNDTPSTNPPQHRLIMRTVGSLRIVLNTKIWDGMSVDKASSKSLRITAMDCRGVVKVFLIVSSPKDIDQLERCLYWRVRNLKKLEEGINKKAKDGV
ncbi:ran-binding protein 3 [Cimex lectularius]|uniref:RanBD1 domain-containing protein n=1 Tax=Cimex lectularius TaxID=79782 RepID=A0A8I6RUZ7_CIMLE|nr:ran-binding protein 3 [Cimex lectularius]